MLAAGAYQLRTVLLDSAVASVKLKQIAMMRNAALAYHLTLTLDGWSNRMMESIYSWNVAFPSRRVILLKADELSEVSHTGEALSGDLQLSRLDVVNSCELCVLLLSSLDTGYKVTIRNFFFFFAEMIIKEMLKWGPEKLAAIVTDNASNMVKTRRLVLQRFPHLIEVRYTACSIAAELSDC